MAVYDRLPANSTYNTSTKKQKGTEEQIRRGGGGKVLAIVRTVANMCIFGTAPIFQSILLIPSLSFSFYISIYTTDHRTIELRYIKEEEEKKVDTHVYTANCRFSFFHTSVYICALVRSR